MATNPQGAAFATTGEIHGSLTAQNTWVAGADGLGLFLHRGRGAVSISGTFAATVTLQKRRDDEDTTTGWKDVNFVNQTTLAPVPITVPMEFKIDDGAPAYYRIGIKTLGFTSGTVDLRIDRVI